MVEPTWLSAEDEGGPSKLYYKFQALCARAVVVSRTPLGNFCRQCLHMMGSCHDSSKQLFPCPIPAKIGTPSSELRSGRRRSRYSQRVTIREHLRLVVASCNWLVLGRPKELSVDWPPCSAAQTGFFGRRNQIVLPPEPRA